MAFEDLLKNPVKRAEEDAENEDDGQDVMGNGRNGRFIG